jgi:hypothetical protein
MIGIDCIAPIQNSNQLQNGAGSERGLALCPLILLIRVHQSLRPILTQRLSVMLALASPALRRDVACPTNFRPAKRVNKQRVSQKTVERLIDDGLLRWRNASRTFVVLTERGRALKGD